MRAPRGREERCRRVLRRAAAGDMPLAWKIWKLGNNDALVQTLARALTLVRLYIPCTVYRRRRTEVVFTVVLNASRVQGICLLQKTRYKVRVDFLRLTWSAYCNKALVDFTGRGGGGCRLVLI